MQTPPKPPTSTRKTIGIFAAQLTRVWGAEFMNGVMDAAETNDVNLVCLVGGKPAPFQAERLSYGLYDIAKSKIFDGLLMASDVAHGLTTQDVSQFCQTFASIPIVSYAVSANGVTRLMADNQNGVRAVIRHLIEEHGYKRIAFIRGLRGQIESDIRFQAYQDEMRAHGIRYNPLLVAEGDFTPEGGRAAIRALLDVPDHQLQAIAVSNDRMAFGAMEMLEERGYRVPDDIALTGFDDVSEAQSMGVPLTTVSQPFYEMGKQAFDFLMKRINGEKVAGETTVPATLKIRWSCGCLPESVKRAWVQTHEVAQTGRLENKRDAAVRALFGAADIRENHADASELREAFREMWDAFLSDLHAEKHSETFLKRVQICIQTLQKNGCEVAVWNNVLSTLRKHALGSIINQDVALKAENLFQQARMLTGEISQRAQALRRLQQEKQEEILGALGFSMAPAMSLDEIGEAIAKNFPALGLRRWYIMFYSDVSAPGSSAMPTPHDYRLVMEYEDGALHIPQEKTKIDAEQLAIHSATAKDKRYTVMVMPLALARNHFGFMWTEAGSRDFEAYTRSRNLISSALLRIMLVQQREQAQREVERLLEEARQRATELASARDAAEKAAQENARMYEKEQSHRRSMELLARASRQLSSLSKMGDVPQQILEELISIVQFERGAVFLEDINGIPSVVAHRGFPADAPVSDLQYRIETDEQSANMYDAVARMKEPIQVGDTKNMKGWLQSEWAPSDRSWLGVPLYYQKKTLGMVVISRGPAWAFTRDDAVVSTAFAAQAAIALENAHLYDAMTKFGQDMERMVAQRVDELHAAYNALEKMDKNKSTFIRVAAHELRTPLTVIKGYLGMFKTDKAIQANPMLLQAIDGVINGTDRLHQIVNSMLDVVRLETQTITPHPQTIMVGTVVRLVHKDYVKDLAERKITMTLDNSINTMHPIEADPQLLQRALDQVVVNAIKFTPDGGNIVISASVAQDPHMGRCAEIRVKDSGIGIDPSERSIIFEKLYQLGNVEFHSSSRTNFKGGGPGLGLALAAGIIKAHGGRIWVESDGHDEEKMPGSIFYIHIPLAK